VTFKVLHLLLAFKMHAHYIYGEVTSHYLWSQCDRHFVGQHVVLCVVKWWRFVALFEKKIESVGLRKRLYYCYLIKKVTSTDVRITNISQSLPHKMAENGWYEEITSLSPYVYAVARPSVCRLSVVCYARAP